MALGFNNAPANFGNVDYSGYAQGTATAMRGLTDGLGSVVQGVMMRAEDRKKKEREKKMREDLAPIVQQMSGGAIDIKDVSPEALPLLWDRAQQMEKQRAAQEQQAQMVQTINELASRPMDQQTIVGLQQAGVDPKVIGMLVDLSKPKEQPWMPQAVDAGGVPMVMTSPSSAQIVREPQPGTPEGWQPRVIEQGGVKLYEREPGKFDQVSVPRAAQTANGAVALMADSVRQQIAKKQQEILAERQAIDAGDEKAGFLNTGGSRKDRMQRMLLELDGLQNQLAGLEQSGGGAPSAPVAGGEGQVAAPAAPVAPAAPAAPQGQRTTWDEFNTW